MGTYAESLLADGEVILMRKRQHVFALLAVTQSAFALYIVAIALLAALVIFKLKDTAAVVTSGAAAIAFVIGLVIFAWSCPFRFCSIRSESFNRVASMS